MSQPPGDATRHVADRITSIEERWTYLERTVEALDEVLRQVQDRLDRLERRVKLQGERLGEITSLEGESPPDASGSTI